MYYGITFPTPSQPFSQSFSQPLSESLSLHCSILSHCSHLCLIILFSTSYCSFDLPSFFRSLLIFFKLILPLSFTPLVITCTLSIAHSFNRSLFQFSLFRFSTFNRSIAFPSRFQSFTCSHSQ